MFPIPQNPERQDQQRQGDHQHVQNRQGQVLSPIGITALGVLLFIAGLVLGRIPMQPPGGTRLAAFKWAHLCQQVPQAFGGQIGETSFCHQAQGLTILGGVLLILGAAGIIAGAISGGRRKLHTRGSQRAGLAQCAPSTGCSGPA
jgi:hypothetical protein